MKNNKQVVIILNGPPGSGKDTIGKSFLQSRIGQRDYYTDIRMFKAPMFYIAAATLGMPLSELQEQYEDREWKEKIRPEWGNKSIRDLMIAISESYVKPFFGPNYFGEAARDDLKTYPPVNTEYVHIFTDGGFPMEIEVLDKEFYVQVVHIHREGCDFSGDSRSYVEGISRPAIRLDNNGSLDDAVAQLQRIVDDARSGEQGD